MKNFFIPLLLLVLSISIGGCGNVNKTKETTVTLYAAVIDQKDNSFCVTPIQNEPAAEKLLMIPWDSEKYVQRGTLLRIEYDGAIAESYPAQICNPISIEVCEEKDLQIDGSKYRDAYEAYIRLLINPDYPCGEEALSQFVHSIADGMPAKYSRYIIGDEGDPVLFYYEYVIDDAIGNYIIEGWDTTYDKWGAQPGITYYRFPYISKDEYGNICVSECVDTEAYHSVFNYSTDDTSYVYINDIGSGDLAENLSYGNAIPVLRINASATATLGIDPISNPNVITVNDKGTVIVLELAEMGDYLARGVYFKTDADFAVVCENMTGTAEYLVKEYSIKNGEVVEEKTFYSEKLPVE